MSQSVAYLSGMFPLASETFVYREVRGLRALGWRVMAVSLNATPAQNLPADLYNDRMVLYSAGTFLAAAKEMLTHPLRTLRTQFAAFDDMLSPDENLSLKNRLKIPLQALAALGLANILRRNRIARIHCHFAHAPTTVGMYASMQLGIPFSFTGHANDLFQRRALLAKKLRRADFVACISRWHREWYQSIVADNSGKYEVIRCGVDVEQFQPAPHGENSKFRIVTLCRLVEKKGVDTLIRAAAELQKKNASVELSIAGTGPEEHRLRNIGQELCAGDWLKFLGPVDNTAVPKLFAESDVFALPCRADSQGDRDGIPVVLMEAMACGLPVIAGDLPAIRELITDGVDGFLIPGNDIPALVDRLERLANDPALRSKLGLSGRQKVLQEFAFAPNLDRLVGRLKN